MKNPPFDLTALFTAILQYLMTYLLLPLGSQVFVWTTVAMSGHPLTMLALQKSTDLLLMSSMQNFAQIVAWRHFPALRPDVKDTVHLVLIVALMVSMGLYGCKIVAINDLPPATEALFLAHLFPFEVGIVSLNTLLCGLCYLKRKHHAHVHQEEIVEL